MTSSVYSTRFWYFASTRTIHDEGISIHGESLQSINMQEDSNFTSANMTWEPAVDPWSGFPVFNNNKHRMNFLPINLGEKLDKLLCIFMVKSGLREVNKIELRNLKKLIYIDFSYNEIQKIEQNLFSQNPNLEFIDLSYRFELLNLWKKCAKRRKIR